jgi:hypothetical protein
MKDEDWGWRWPGLDAGHEGKFKNMPLIGKVTHV